MENIEKNLENYDGGHDLPDSRDFTIEEMGGSSNIENLPRKFFLREIKNHNQGNIGACTLFGSVNAYNESLKTLKISLERTWEIWQEAKKRGASDTGGWWLQFALQLLKDLGEIPGYIRIGLLSTADVNKIKQAIVQGKAVVTGVGNGNWSEIIRTHEYSRTPRVSGHIFDIVGYDDDYRFADGSIGGFFVENSWGENGYFWFKYKDVEILFSQYIFEDVTEIKKVRKNIYLQKSFENKIWNEERPADKATASEIRIMLNRALAVADNKISSDWRTFRSSYALLFEEKIVRGKAKIYNEERKYFIATDDEIAIMFTRAVTRNAGLGELVLTREQVAEVVGRDFL